MRSFERAVSAEKEHGGASSAPPAPPAVSKQGTSFGRIRHPPERGLRSDTSAGTAIREKMGGIHFSRREAIVEPDAKSKSISALGIGHFGETQHRKNGSQESAVMSNSCKTILCIQGERDASALLNEKLVEHGFNIDVAHNGRDGLAAIVHCAPDLVLCHVASPDLSGLDVLERLVQTAPLYSYVPFIFLTTLASRESELGGRRLGADDYVIRPIDFDRLVTIIDTRLARTPVKRAKASTVVLSQREIETLTWAARGKTSMEIAQIVNLTKRTVDFHIDNARAKLGVATRIQAAVMATKFMLIEP
jgi:DNA-binding NarL/FixJ family response regulator